MDYFQRQMPICLSFENYCSIFYCYNCDVALEMYFSPTVLSFSSVCVYINCIYNLVVVK